MVVIWSKNIKELIGKVVSTKMQWTIVVTVDRVREDRIYSKRATVQKRYYVDDAEGLAAEGDTVRIRETKPISKLKRWKLIEVTHKAL